MSNIIKLQNAILSNHEEGSFMTGCAAALADMQQIINNRLRAEREIR